MRASYPFIEAQLKQQPQPAAFLLWDAFEMNANRLRLRANGKPIRVATKSVRCLHILQKIVQMPGYQGLMTYSARETLFLAQNGLDDFLLAYPCSLPQDAAALALVVKMGKTLRVMTDLPEHLELLNQASQNAGIVMPICLDIDMSTDFPGIWFGVRRSSLRTAKDALAFALKTRNYPHLKLEAVMGYEAQIAGLPDNVPGKWLMNGIIRFLKKRSRQELAQRRAEVVEALRTQGFELKLVNGGGTGSLESSTAEAVVTEVTAGSGLYQSTLFDGHRSINSIPAMGYTVPITRHPVQQIYTAAGGGYPASGPTVADKSPQIWFPEGAQLLKDEGVGEVQTPFTYNGPKALQIGDLLVLRHAKAGEMLERFQTLHILHPNAPTLSVPTYRGLGHHFG